MNLAFICYLLKSEEKSLWFIISAINCFIVGENDVPILLQAVEAK